MFVFSKSPRFWSVLIALGVWVSCASRVSAVVVAGASGGGNTLNNTTQEQMESELGISDAGFYQNVIAYSDAGAVYIGWADTDNGRRAYALTAQHITFASTLVINGITYSVTRTQISNSDVALLTLSQTEGLMPSLSALTLASSTPSIGTSVIMAGYGRDRVQDAATTPNGSDAVVLVTGSTGYTTESQTIKRWGTNTTASIGGQPTTQIAISGTTVVAATVFSQPGNGQWLSTNEAQAVRGDSGGGVFSYSGVLYGLMSTVSNPSEVGTVAFFGQATYFANIATYKSAIESAIGYSLIPEPSPVFLLLAAGLGIFGVLIWKNRSAAAAVSRDIVREKNS